MTIGIIGSDDRAVSIGRFLQQCGNSISFSDPRSRETADRAAAALDGGATAGTARHQAATCDALVLAVHWDDLDSALSALGDYEEGLLIDATRPREDIDANSGAELLARRLGNGHVVKAFVENLIPGGTVKVCSDDPHARLQVETMIAQCGGRVKDLGPLSNAREIECSVAEELHVEE